MWWLAAGSVPINGQAGSPPGPLPAQPGTPTTVVADANYVVGPNDRVRILVWNQDNISGEYTVSGDGSFSFPLIGRVVAGGLTIAKLEGHLTELLKAGYFRNPQVTATIVEYRSRQIFVMGAVRQPAAYPLVGEMTVVEALARAGSTTADAADHAFIIRSVTRQGPVLPGEDASATVTRFDLREFDGGQLSSVMKVTDGETIFVPRAANIYVYGQVRNPGSYPIGQDTTIRQALSLAGGIAEFGAVGRLRVLRREGGKEREIKVELDDLVKPGDTVVVPERFF